MSIGNLKDTGNQGNNFPWQYKVLLGLDKIFQAFSGGGGTSYLAPQVRNANIVRSSGTGSFTNIYSISIANVGGSNGTVNGTTLGSNETISLDAGSLNNVINSISFNATGTEFLVVYLS